MQIKKVIVSPIGMANHTPVVFNMGGKIISMIRINTKVLKKETRADNLPLDTDVKNT